ncbi:MAG: glycoside hydrolase family 18 protein [Desulfobacteraceae bacterium]|jgi:hypothetical protein
MNHWHYLKRPPWRTVLLLFIVVGFLGLAYLAWTPGKRVRDGRHDLGSNGIWVEHGWLGDDLWFSRNRMDKRTFRDSQKIQELAELLASHGVKYVFPHLCPSNANGKIAQADPKQTERFLDHFEDFKILPWIGGVLGVHCSPQSPEWRTNFVSSVVHLLQSHTRLGGVQLNIEPMPSGHKGFLVLLEELRRAMPDDKILSVAAYPPPTRWHPFPEVHWEEEYFRQVAQRVDQMVVMMYDSAIRWQKPYQHLMSSWTSDVLSWTGDTKVLLGIPVYDDAGVEYHFPQVENLRNALLGIHAGLSQFKSVPDNYSGVAIYCEWEMDDQEWEYLRKEFEKAQ